MERKIIQTEKIKKRVPRWAKTFFTYTTIIERITLGILVVLLIISGTFSITNFIKKNTHLIPRQGGTYHEAAVGQPRHINPILAGANDLDADISRLVYSGLFSFDNNLQLNNDLATSYEISTDEKQYTVHLQQNVLWHDGKPFTASDVIFTIRSIQTPDYGSPLMTAFQGVAVEEIDEHTVLFTLPQPYAPFLTSLTVGIVPEHVWSSIEPQNASLAEQMLKPVGTGPFQFSEIVTRRKTGDITALHLEKNLNYYHQPSFLDKIIFTFYTSHEEAAQALLTNKADGIGFLPLHVFSDIQHRNTLNTHRLLLPQYFAIFFNQQKNEALREAGVRSALALATDRKQIVANALQSQGESLHLPIPPGIISYHEEMTTPDANLEAAKQNLQESGWEDSDNDGIREKNGKKLTIKITTTDWPEYISTAKNIKQQWQEIGVAVELEHLGAGTIQQTIVQPREYEALLFGEILPADPDPYPFWHSTQARSPGLNLSLFKDKTTDKLLEEARKISDTSVRQEKYQEFQNKILEHNPAIILYRPFYLFTTKKVYGVEANYAELPSGRFNNITEWHINRKRVWND
jgi:peptide/nickel transport system substrate-binding protein